jgi:hypothetical protein
MDFELLMPGSRIHAAAPCANSLASHHVATCLGVFTADLTPDLAARMDIYLACSNARTLGVVFPALGQ